MLSGVLGGERAVVGIDSGCSLARGYVCAVGCHVNCSRCCNVSCSVGAISFIDQCDGTPIASRFDFAGLKGDQIWKNAVLTQERGEAARTVRDGGAADFVVVLLVARVSLRFPLATFSNRCGRWSV